MKLLIPLLVVLLLNTCATTSNGNNPDLQKQLNSGKDVLIENQVFEEVLDFTKLFPAHQVNNNLKQVRINASITFKNCKFKQDVLAYSKDENDVRTTLYMVGNLSFLNCGFEGSVNFREATILGRLVGAHSYFEAPVNFESGSFFQHVHFNEAGFHADVRFHNATFYQTVNFLNAAFDNNVSFQGSVFHDDAQFSNGKYFGYTDFSSCRWNAGVFFNYAEFADRSFFNNASFYHWADFLSVKFNYAEVGRSRFFGKADFSGSEVQDKLVFRDNLFFMTEPDLSFIEEDKIVKE